MKKIFSLFVTILVTTSLWAYDFQSGDLYYKITSSSAPYTVEVTYEGSFRIPNSNNNIVTAAIPAAVTYNGMTYSVTSIGDRAFFNCRSLTSITIPNSVTSIGGFAFDGCSSLVSMVVESGNTKYDSRDNCNAIIETATNILIAGCQNTIIPNSVTSIGGHAFYDCSALTSITIPNSVTSIGDYAFYDCSSLTSITIPNSVTSIGDYAFCYCFSYCSSLISITIPNSVTSIGEGTFNGCELLTSVTIPNSVKSIGERAFNGCFSLTSITVPNSVTSIGESAFSRCFSLVSMVVESGNTTYDSRNNCNAIIETATNTLIAGCQKTIIPNSVTSIGVYAFYYCSSLTSITIPNSVTSIGSEAFYYCSSLTSITIPNSVTSIGSEAFSGCFSLTSITIPNSVKSIGDAAFDRCTSLTSITIPNSVTSIGDRAFYGCDSLTSIYVEATIPPTLNYDSFTSSPICYIPSGTLAAYQASAWASQVSKFVEQETAAPTTITYELNGGVTNDDNWLSKGDMWTAFCADAGVTTLGTLEEVKALGDPYAAICTPLGASQAQAILDNAKWDWLEAYVMEVQNADPSVGQGGGVTALTEGASSAGWRYAFAAFFLEGQRASWPKSTDFSVAGTPEAFIPAWKHAFANPTEPTTEWVLNAPYKEGKTFDGWYWNADFSGKKITTVNAETTGTLYAKWVEYIPTVVEVRALDDDTETKVSGVVNFISGKNIYIQDATGGILVYTSETPSCTVGQKIVAKGVKVIYAGAPEVKSAVIESAEAATLFDSAAFETLAALVADSLEHKYFATRVTVPGLRIVSYDSFNCPTVEDALGNQAFCYKMVLDPTVFPVGTNVTVTAIAGWYNGFQFVGAPADIVRPIVGKKENYTYPERANGRYKLENNWIFSNMEDNYAANKPSRDGYVRGMAAKDGIIYFIDRDTKTIVRVDGKTGNMLDPIVLQGTDTLFRTQQEDGTWADGTILPYNDIKFDQAGNCLIGACTTGATKCQTFYIYVVDLATGVCTKLIEDYLWDNPGLDQVQFRFDAFGCAGDVTKNGVVMAADAYGSWNVYRWLITDGVAGEGEQIAVTLDPTVDQSLFINAAGYGTAPQIFPQDELGELFYVDGFNTLPMLFYGNPEEGAVLLDDFINVPTGVKVWNNADDTIAMNAYFNGLVEFQVGEEHFLLMGATSNTEKVPTTYALYNFSDNHRDFSDLEPLWYFPHNGMGTMTNVSRVSMPTIEVDGNTAKLYIYSADNGYACYTFNIDDQIQIDTHTLIVNSNNDSMGNVAGSGTYKEGKHVELSAVANYGYHFAQWSDGNTDNPRIVQVIGDATYTAHFDKNTFTVTTYCNSEYGVVTPSTSGAYLDIITLEAISNIGYSFSQWSDGNTDNPRALLLTQDTILMAEFTQAYSGKCGDDLYWAYDNTTQTLSISGMGDMYDYTATTQPWVLFKDQIMAVDIANTATSIGTSAFEGCRRIGTVNIGANIIEIGENAFAGCTRLYDIYCYPTYPPFAETSSFANYNVYLYVPCVNIREYEMDIVWGNFKYIKCMGAEGDEVEDGTVEVTPSTTSVTITWPTEENANTYIIEIKKDGVVFCRLTFNADGQLLSISFAPGRNGNHPAQYATKTTNGLRFTVTGLEEGTNYTYDVISKDENNESIETYSGEFRTQSNTPTDVDNINASTSNVQKLFRNGQLIIVRDGVEYNAMGQEM